MIQFQLFGIPVRIEPWFWLLAFFLGGGTNLGASAGSTRVDIVWVLVWMVAICFSVLVHEFGHALTARKLSGGRHHIRLWGFGGLAYHEGSTPKRKDRLWTILMGPGAGFALFLLTVLAMVIALGSQLAFATIGYQLFGILPSDNATGLALREYFQGEQPSYRFFRIFILINFWWSIINLLPVFPLDGGQFLSTVTGNTLLAYKVGAVVGVIAAIAMFMVTGSLWNTFIFGFLAYQNFKNLQQFKGSGGWT